MLGLCRVCIPVGAVVLAAACGGAPDPLGAELPTGPTPLATPSLTPPTPTPDAGTSVVPTTTDTGGGAAARTSTRRRSSSDSTSHARPTPTTTAEPLGPCRRLRRAREPLGPRQRPPGDQDRRRPAGGRRPVGGRRPHTGGRGPRLDIEAFDVVGGPPDAFDAAIEIRCGSKAGSSSCLVPKKVYNEGADKSSEDCKVTKLVFTPKAEQGRLHRGTKATATISCPKLSGDEEETDEQSGGSAGTTSGSSGSGN